MAFKSTIQITGNKVINGANFSYNLGQEALETEPLYVKVQSISGNKNQLTTTVVFISEADSTTVLYRDYQFLLDLEGPNPIKQAYQFLKTLPEFSDAVDC
jgi:hypothetical protein